MLLFCLYHSLGKIEGYAPEDLLKKPLSYFKKGKFSDEQARTLRDHFDNRRLEKIQQIKQRREALAVQTESQLGSTQRSYDLDRQIQQERLFSVFQSSFETLLPLASSFMIQEHTFKKFVQRGRKKLAG